VDDTRVLIGGRKFRKIPPQSKLFMENEEPQGSVRQRYVFTSTPHHTPNQPPPPYNSANYLTPPPSSKSQPNQNSHHDSGFYGSFDTPDRSHNSPSLNSTIPHKSNLWDSVTSPVSSIKNRLTGGGRPNFLDDDRSRRWNLQPQQILGCLLFVTIFSSLGFAILISVKHFGAGGGSSGPVNGKYQSLQFASEKMNVVENAAMSREDVEVAPQEAEVFSDPIFDVMNEIGQLSDLELSEKIKTEELGEKIKASGIKIENIDEMFAESNEIPSVDAISEELLTTRPLLVEHPAPTQAPTDRKVLKVEYSESKTTDNVIGRELNVEDNVKESIPEESINPEDIPTKWSLKSRKKSKVVNPLTKSVEVQKMSKAKLVEKVRADLRDVESVDYPDLPTFRGLQPVEDETEEDSDDVKKEIDYPEDPSAFR